MGRQKMNKKKKMLTTHTSWRKAAQGGEKRADQKAPSCL